MWYTCVMDIYIERESMVCVLYMMYILCSIIDVSCGVYILLYMYDGVHGVCTVCMYVIHMWDCIMCMFYIACVVYVCMRYWHV